MIFKDTALKLAVSQTIKPPRQADSAPPLFRVSNQGPPRKAGHGSPVRHIDRHKSFKVR